MARSMFFFYTELLTDLPMEEAIVIAFLLQSSPAPRLKTKTDKMKKYEHWTRCSVKEMDEFLSLSAAKQNRIVNRLKQKGLIKIKLIGCPPVRWFKVDKDKLITQFHWSP